MQSVSEGVEGGMLIRGSDEQRANRRTVQLTFNIGTLHIYSTERRIIPDMKFKW